MEGKPQHESCHVRQGLPEGRVPDASVTMEVRQEAHPNTALSGVHRGQAGLPLRARGGKESPNVQTTRHVLIRGARRHTPSHPGGSRTSNGGSPRPARCAPPAPAFPLLLTHLHSSHEKFWHSGSRALLLAPT